LTAEDFLQMPGNAGYELEDGRLVEKNVSLLSSWVAGRCGRLLGTYCDKDLVGLVMDEGATYQCFPGKPNRVRRPDFSFVGKGRVSRDQFEAGHCRLAPDLVGEVVSPRDLIYDLTRRIQQYLQAGVRLIWVVNPEDHTVLIYRADGSIQGLRENQELTGEDVVSGFRCRVADLFPSPEVLALLAVGTDNGTEQRPS
jgi:Uma2 family endonuclease